MLCVESTYVIPGLVNISKNAVTGSQLSPVYVCVCVCVYVCLVHIRVSVFAQVKGIHYLKYPSCVGVEKQVLFGR